MGQRVIAFLQIFLLTNYAFSQTDAELLFKELRKDEKDVVLIKSILEHTDVNAKDIYKQAKIKDGTPLHYAVWDGHLELVKFLVDKGANVNMMDINGKSPIFYGLKYKEIIGYLIDKGADLKIKDNNGTMPIHISVPLKSIESALLLIENGVDVNVKDFAGETPLHKIASLYTSEGERSVTYFRFTQMLIEKGGNVNAQNNFGNTPLHLIAQTNYIDYAGLLLQLGADKNILNCMGRKPYQRAQPYHKGDMFEFLMPEDLKKNYLNTIPLWKSIAMNNVSIAKQSLKEGADSLLRDINDRNALDMVYERGFKSLDDFLLNRNRHKHEPSLKVQIGHLSMIRAIAYSPDGKYILSGDDSSIIKLWDIKSGKLIHNYVGYGDESITALAFSPDSKFIVSADYGNTLKLWDINHETEIHTFEGYKININSVAFSPDGRYILSASDYDALMLWDAKTWKLIKTFGDNEYNLKIALFGNDGTIISATKKELIVWSIESGQIIRKLGNGLDYVGSIAITKNGNTLAVCKSKRIELYNIQTGSLIKVFEGDFNYSESISFAENETKIVSISKDNQLMLFDIDTGSGLEIMEIGNLEGNSLFSPDGRFLITTENFYNIKIRDIINKQVLQTLEKGKPLFANLVLNSEINVKVNSAEEISFWNVTRDSLINKFGAINLLNISKDNAYIALKTQPYSSKFGVVELNSGKLISVSSNTQLVLDIDMARFSPDGSKILTVDHLTKINQNSAVLWNTHTGEYIRDLKIIGHRGFSFTPNGEEIIASIDNHIIGIFDVETGINVYSLAGQEYPVRVINFTPDGEKAIIGDFGGNIKIWDINSWNLIRNIEAHGYIINSIACSSDGKYMVSSGGKYIKLWDLEFGKEVHTFKGHQAEINSAVFSKDNKYIYSSGMDYTFRVWDIEGKKELCTIYHFENNPGDKLIITPDGYFDGTPEIINAILHTVTQTDAGYIISGIDQLKGKYYLPGLYEKILGLK